MTAEGLLLPAGARLAASLTRPVIAVFGLARGCGTTVVARALAAELATRDVGEAAAVACGVGLGGVPLASRAALRLARVLEAVPGAATRAVGRVCLVGGAEPLALSDTARHHAPLVLDAGSAAVGGAPAAVADRVLLVAAARVEPALAAVVSAGVARVASQPLLVLNRAGERADERWAGCAAIALPESRMGAQLALGGREPRGGFGEAIRRLADLCERPS
jgi:hypothetical protein